METAPRDQPAQTSGFDLTEDAPVKPTFACGTCGKLYSRLEYVRRHERKHQDSKPFPCTECTKSFARSDVLLRHKRRCHPNSETSTTVGNHSSSRSNAIPTTSPPVPAAPSPRTLEYLASVASQSEHQEHLSHPQPVSSSRDQRRESAAPYSRPILFNTPSSDAIHTRQSISEQRSDSVSAPSLYGVRSSLDSNSTSSSSNYSFPFALESPSSLSRPLPQFQLPPQLENIQPNAYSAPNIAQFGSFVPTDAPFKDESTISQLGSTLPPFQPEGSLLSKEWGHPLFSPSFSSPFVTSMTTADGTILPLSQSLPSPMSAVDFALPSSVSSESAESNLDSSSQPPLSQQPSIQPSVSFQPAPFGSMSRTGSPSSNSFPLLYPQLFGNYQQSGQPGSHHPEAGFLFEGLLDYQGSPRKLPYSSIGPQEASPRIQEATNEEEKQEQFEKTQLEPEKKLLVVESTIRLSKCGSADPAIQPGDQFYISPTKFSPCFGIEHWQLPPLRVLTKIAHRTMVQLIPHIPMLHSSTFVISQVPICIAFSVCTIGGPRRGPQFSDDKHQIMKKGAVWEANGWNWPVFSKERNKDQLDASSGTEKPGYGGVYWEQESADVDSWDGLKSVVRRDKTNMMVKSFCRSTGKLFTDYNVGLVQALILYNSPAVLSDSLVQRMAAHMNFGAVANIARQVGIFDAFNGHIRTTPIYDWEDCSVDSVWKKWVKSEGIRRTAWVLYLLDSLCSIETGCPRLVTPLELSDFPLPSPDPVWEAPTGSVWAEEFPKYPCLNHSFEQGMRSIYNISDDLQPVSNGYQAGSFFWLVLIVTLTRELIDLGEGRPRDRTCSWAGDVEDDMLKEEISKALSRWKTRWCSDSLCEPIPPKFCEDGVEDLWSAGPTYNDFTGSEDSPFDSPSSSEDIREAAGERTGSSSFDGTSSSNLGSSTASFASNKGERLPYSDVLFCRDALPYFWFCKILLGTLDEYQAHVAPNGGSWFIPGFSVFKSEGIDYRAALETARIFSKTGEGAF